MFLVEVVADKILDPVDNDSPDLRVAQLVLGLGLEDRILDLHRHRADNAFPHILAQEFLAGELVDAFQDPFAEGREMGAAFVGIGAVDKGEVVLAIALGMAEGEFQGLVLVIEGLIQPALLDLIVQQIKQAVGGKEAFLFQVKFQTGVEIGIAPQPFADKLQVKGILLEMRVVGQKLDQGAVLFRGFALILPLQHAFGKHGPGKTALPEGGNRELFGQGIDRLGAHSVEAHGKLKDIGIVFRPGIDHRNAFHQLAQGDAAAEIAHLDPALFAVVDGDNDLLARSHDKFIDRIINHLFEQDIDAVVRMGAVAQPADIHAGPQTDMLQRA